MNPTRKSNYIMIPKNTAIPNQVNQRFVTTTPNQQRIHIYVLEGEAARSRGVHADCRLSDHRACPPGFPPARPST